MTDLLRAQVVLQHRNGLPRDAVSMNYWAAAPAGASEALALAWANDIVQMFTTPVAPRTIAMGELLGATIADPGHVVKVYDYDMTTGDRLNGPDSPPIAQSLFALTGLPRPSTSLPSEVALCVTNKNLSGATPGGGNFATPAAQRRGRVFFGPINPAYQLDETTTNISRPDGNIIDIVGAAHDILLTAHGDTSQTPWVVYSRPFAGRAEISAATRLAAGGPNKPLRAIAARPGTAYLVEQISIDNAWDTQRKRGERATSRTVI